MSLTQGNIRSLITTQAAEWFVAHRAGALPDTQREAFIEWLCASPAHVREYLAMAGFAEDVSHVAKAFTLPTNTLLERAGREDNVVPLEAVTRHSSTAPARRQRSRYPMLAAGAFAALVLAAMLVSTWWLRDHASYSTAHAEQRSWRLPDGSTVHLNSNSRIELGFDAGQRKIDLIRGQAVFQVAKDAARPFRVYAGDAIVEAVGTKFDVYRRPEGTLVSVMEGRVAVHQDRTRRGRVTADESTASAAPILLSAGEQAHIHAEQAAVSKESKDVRKTVAWLQRQVVFDHDPLAVAVEEFNRYSERPIHIADPAIGQVEISGIFSAYDADSFIRFLERQPGMRLNHTDRGAVVTAE